MARMTGGEAIVKALAREGVKVAFGLPGVQLYGIVTAFRDEPMRFITVRHEGSSTYMADGYARAGGGVGVAVAVPGPGLLNASAGLNTAYSASSPVLLIAGQVPRHQIGKKIGVLHELDNQLDAIAGSTKWRQSIMQVADAPRIVREAFAQLRYSRDDFVRFHRENFQPEEVSGLACDIDIGREIPALDQQDGAVRPQA